MFGLFAKSRHNPQEIAKAILEVAVEREPLVSFVEHFKMPTGSFNRTFISVVVFLYCWARNWSFATHDSRVVDAYKAAAKIIATALRDAENEVVVGDYVLSQSEFPSLLFALNPPSVWDFIRSPENAGFAGLDNPKAMAMMRSLKVRLGALTKALMDVRGERMTTEIASLMALADEGALLLGLSDTLYEQVGGVARWEVMHDPDLLTERQIDLLRQSAVIDSMMERVDAALARL